MYRWAVRQMQQQPETVKDELRVFLGQHPSFRAIEDYLPTQRSKALDGSRLELKEHQKEALRSLEEMRCRIEIIALLYHATGTGKTVTPSWTPSGLISEPCSWPIRWNWWTRPREPYGRCGPGPPWAAMWRA